MNGAVSTTTTSGFTNLREKKSMFGNEPDTPIFLTMVRNADGSVSAAGTPDASKTPAANVSLASGTTSLFGNAPKKHQQFSAPPPPPAVPRPVMPETPSVADVFGRIADKMSGMEKKHNSGNTKHQNFSVQENFTLDPSWKRERDQKAAAEAAASSQVASGKISYQQAIISAPRAGMITGIRTTFQKQGIAAVLDKYRPSATVYSGQTPSVSIPSVIPQANLDVRTQSVVSNV
jgi:hypothetical protein